LRRERGARHDIAIERLDECDARIFATAGPIIAHLERFLGLQGNPEPIDALGVAGRIEEDARNADAGVVASPDKSWKQVEVAVAASRGARIENVLDLLRIAWLRHHDDADPLQLNRTHVARWPVAIRSVCLASPPGFFIAMVRITA
jgi:hypothetical protein